MHVVSVNSIRNTHTIKQLRTIVPYIPDPGDFAPSEGGVFTPVEKSIGMLWQRYWVPEVDYSFFPPISQINDLMMMVLASLRSQSNTITNSQALFALIIAIVPCLVVL